MHFEPYEHEAPFGRCGAFPETGQLCDDVTEWMQKHKASEWPNWTDADWMQNCHPESLAFTADASGYASSLVVRSDFGCIAHVATQENQP
jgi:hypothetical protein